MSGCEKTVLEREKKVKNKTLVPKGFDVVYDYDILDENTQKGYDGIFLKEKKSYSVPHSPPLFDSLTLGIVDE